MSNEKDDDDDEDDDEEELEGNYKYNARLHKKLKENKNK